MSTVAVNPARGSRKLGGLPLTLKEAVSMAKAGSPGRAFASTLPPARLTAEGPITEFRFWVAEAAPGERRIYHTGYLWLDRFDAEGVPNKLDALARAVLVEAIAGRVLLTQRRLGASNYEYIATRALP